MVTACREEIAELDSSGLGKQIALEKEGELNCDNEANELSKDAEGF